jgi:hypothetical protein
MSPNGVSWLGHAIRRCAVGMIIFYKRLSSPSMCSPLAAAYDPNHDKTRRATMPVMAGLAPEAGARISSQGRDIDTRDDAFGYLRASNDVAGSPDALRARLDEDGYLYIRDFFPPDLILKARLSVLAKLREDNAASFDPTQPLADGIVARDQRDAFRLNTKPTFRKAGGERRDPDERGAFRPDVAAADPHIRRVIFGPEIAGFYAKLFGEPVRHFDYIWLRLMGPGLGTPCHCDTVYMGRGSRDLLTCWIPYGEVPLDVGGLMILEGSHRLTDRLGRYLSKDVDSYCVNREAERQKVAIEGGWSHRGWLSDRPDLLPEKLGGRWLTAERWGVGDFITFKMTTVHGSLDNRSDRLRISTDTRWQPAAHPIDDRWIGENPPGHSLAGKRGRVC